jgi:hypothetical protein
LNRNTARVPTNPNNPGQYVTGDGRRVAGGNVD